MNIISRVDAQAAGLKRYFTGKPCKHGHIAERLCSCRACTECNLVRALKFEQDNPAIAKARKAKDYVDNKENRKEQGRRWAQSNQEKVQAIKRKWARVHREHKNQLNQHWKRNNQHLVNADAAKRRAAKLKHTPKWANTRKIKSIYSLARLLTSLNGIEYDVDHIVPLQGEFVSGLHCEDNLQIIPARLNRSKGNRFTN